MLRTPSVVVSQAPAALLQLVPMPSCVANTLFAACASRVSDAAVPWNLYGLKIRETQSALKTILLFNDPHGL
jgi:hypothetical protein